MTDRLLKFFATATKLKTLKRTGWQRCGVEPCESVAEHTFGVALLALLLPPTAQLNVDRDRCIRMAIVHDLAEALVGDITPHDAITPEEKHRREEDAIRQLTQMLGHNEPRDLWREFEGGKTAESQLVRDLDVIEMAIQAQQYQKAATLATSNCQRFLDSAKQRIQTPAGRALLKRVLHD